MGHKAIKHHYGIEHIVHINDQGNLAIGSEYITDMIVIRPDGLVENMHPDSYQTFRRLLDGTMHEHGRKEFATILAMPDAFERSIPVFRHMDGNIIEDFVEKLGWPNTTHAGHLLWEGEWFTSREECVKRAVERAKFAIVNCNDSIDNLSAEIEKLGRDISKQKKILAALTK